jgi:hypothetical protein
MATLQDIVKRALRMVGVKAANESLTGAEGADALVMANDLLELWRLSRTMVYSIDRYVFTSIVAGTASYTIGSAATIPIERPVKIEEASWLDNTNSDAPLEIPIHVATYEEWQKVPIKSVSTTHSWILYYEPEVTSGVIYLYPEPSDATYDLVLYVWNPLDAISAISSTVTFPPGYQMALTYNLALNLAAEYGVQNPPQRIAEMAEVTLDFISRVNSPIPKVYPEKAAGAGRRGPWDYRTGQSFPR